jgi:hypothetical protein
LNDLDDHAEDRALAADPETGQLLGQIAAALQPKPAPRPAAPAPAQKDSESRRKSMLAKIHIAKKHCMDTLPEFTDDTYRFVLQERFGVDSSKHLSLQQQHEFLLYFNELGFSYSKSGKNGKKRAAKRRDAPATLEHDTSGLSREALMRKIEALLAEKGRVEGKDMPWNYAIGILKRQSDGVTKCFEHATPEQLRAVIASLMKDAKRHGRRTG